MLNIWKNHSLTFKFSHLYSVKVLILEKFQNIFFKIMQIILEYQNKAGKTLKNRIFLESVSILYIVTISLEMKFWTFPPPPPTFFPFVVFFSSSSLLSGLGLNDSSALCHLTFSPGIPHIGAGEGMNDWMKLPPPKS